MRRAHLQDEVQLKPCLLKAHHVGSWIGLASAVYWVSILLLGANTVRDPTSRA